jgi:hypothetical protein
VIPPFVGGAGSTLKRVVEALGGQLAISVDFDDGQLVKIAL